MTEDAREGVAAAPDGLGETADEIDLIAAVLDGDFDESAPADRDDESPAAAPTDPVTLASLKNDLIAFREAHLDPRRDNIAGAVLAVAIAGFCGTFISLVITDYRNFGPEHFDAGIFDQAAYLLAHGDQFMSSRGLNVFEEHANFGLYLFAPFYRSEFAGPVLLDSAMIVSLGFAAVPVYLIARDRTKSATLGVVIALALLAHFSVSSAIIEGFHPESMALLPLFGAFWFADQEDWPAFATTSIYAVCWAEDIALFVAALGIYLLFAKSRTAGLVTAVAGCGYFLVITVFVLPALGVSGGAMPAGDFGGLGDSGIEAAFNAALFEWDESFRLLERNGAAGYLFDLGQPYGWLPYLSPLWMLLALPQLATNLLEVGGLAASPFTHHVSVPVVGLTLGLIATFARCEHPLARVGMALWLIIFTFNTSVSRGFLPYSDNHRSGVWELDESQQTRWLRVAVELIPDDAAVVATPNISPHLTRRNEIYLWPNPYRREGWGVAGASPVPHPGGIDYLLLDRSTMGDASRELADEVVATWGFEPLYEAGPVVVLQRSP